MNRTWQEANHLVLDPGAGPGYFNIKLLALRALDEHPQHTGGIVGLVCPLCVPVFVQNIAILHESITI